VYRCIERHVFIPPKSLRGYSFFPLLLRPAMYFSIPAR
jgi:hypothetical protein